MAKESNKKSFFDFLKIKDLDDDEFDDDLFDDDDDDDDDDYVRPKKKASNPKSSPDKQQNAYNRPTGTANYNQSSYKAATQSSYNQGYNNYSNQKTQARPVASNNKLVDFDAGRQQRSVNRGSGEVYVIKPQEISESQTVTDFLRNGKTIVINMEGLELAPAQRIIDFIGGACYALGGSLQAISANIFIAAPGSIEVSGDLREEILNESTVSPQLGRY